MNAFFGSSKLTIDDKGRMVMPSRHRDELLKQCGGEVVMTAPFRRFLYIYPAPAFSTLLDRLDQYPDTDPGWNDIKASFTAHARPDVLDRAGRLLLPPELRERIALRKTVNLVGRGNRFELWDQERWDEESAAREARLESGSMPAGFEHFRF